MATKLIRNAPDKLFDEHAVLIARAKAEGLKIDGAKPSSNAGYIRGVALHCQELKRKLK